MVEVPQIKLAYEFKTSKFHIHLISCKLLLGLNPGHSTTFHTNSKVGL